MSKTINSLLQDLTKQLTLISSEPEQEAWWLLEHVTKLRKINLVTQQKFELSDLQQTHLMQCLHERVNENKPLQYIIGSVPFCNLTINVRPPTLIPRPETEEWVSWLINQLQPYKNKPLSILDLCTGSGCIGLAVANALLQASVTGIDIKEGALELAQENKAANNITNIQFLQSDLYTGLSTTSRYDLIVSNPPYLGHDEWKVLDPGVKNWEDPDALIAHNNGIELYEKIISQANIYLNDSSDKSLPRIVLELGVNQSEILKHILLKNNFIDIAVYRDLAGSERWITAR